MRALALALAVAAIGCAERTPLEEGARYLDEPELRREAMVAALVNPDNSYSRQRLASYGLGDRGWDQLPEWTPRSRALTAEDAAAVERDGLAGLAAQPGPPSLWEGVRPTTMDEWVALGQKVFFAYPLRAEPVLEYALARPELAAAVGLERTADGAYPGLATIVDVDGRSRVGMTCALCHSQVEDGRLTVGRARRHFDYGRLRAAYDEETGVPVDPDLLRRMKGWGPGRADVTEDDEDPVAIPDLWGLSAQSALNQAGTIRQETGSPVALALRLETQLLFANRQRVRPPRELALALALYVRQLAPPPRAIVHSDESHRGARIFNAECARCHANEVYGGRPVAVDEVGTDPALARGQARGTGAYRPPALLDVVHAAPYLHHGAVASLAELLSPARLEPAYVGSPLGPGPVPGHAFGTSLDGTDRRALISFLETL